MVGGEANVKTSRQFALKDHQIAQLVNNLTKIAREYHGAQQLRERIAREVLDTLTTNEIPRQQENGTQQTDQSEASP